MKILINDSRKIESIQQDFNRAFPYLKMEFFSKAHGVGAPSHKSQMIHPRRTIGQCRLAHEKGEVIISPSMTVAELEQILNNTYGLSVQVFRKSGKAWLETTVTDSWTLEQQNQHGQELSQGK